MSDPAVCRVGVGKQCLKMFLRIIWMVPKEYHCSYWEQEIKYNVTIEIPGKNLVKYKISDDKRCQDQEYRHSSIYAVNKGTHKEFAESNNCDKSRLLSTKGEENGIEL